MTNTNVLPSIREGLFAEAQRILETTGLCYALDTPTYEQPFSDVALDDDANLMLALSTDLSHEFERVEDAFDTLVADGEDEERLRLLELIEECTEESDRPIVDLTLSETDLLGETDWFRISNSEPPVDIKLGAWGVVSAIRTYFDTSDSLSDPHNPPRETMEIGGDNRIQIAGYTAEVVEDSGDVRVVWETDNPYVDMLVPLMHILLDNLQELPDK